MVKKFRTKIVEIEAVQFTGTNHSEMYDFTEGGWDDEHDLTDDFGDPVNFRARVYDYLPDTWISVAPGQWVVRGAKGEYYPCDDETFHWKYEEI